MKTSKVQIADIASSVASTEVTATVAKQKKGIPLGELKAYQAMVESKVKAGEIVFSEVDENTMVATTAAGSTLTLKLTKTSLDHAHTKVGEMVRVRLTTEKFDAEGKLIAKRPECNGKEVWAIVKPETKFPKGSAPKSTKVARVLKPKAIKPDHSNENWI